MSNVPEVVIAVAQVPRFGRDAVAVLAEALARSPFVVRTINVSAKAPTAPLVRNDTGDCLILLAHPCHQHDGFAVEGRTASVECLKAGSWRQDSDLRLYAHTCNGSVVLGSQAWQDSVEEWVSYEGSIEILDTPISADLWLGLLIEIGRDFARTHSPEAAIASIEGLYRRAIRSVDQMFSLGDSREVMKATLQLAADALCASSE
ncbi:MAG: hypothetical protein JWM95_338 [Gemmatimonadetes bacterium]|nr:hypothetical protein [Gemmatimonadota bacterium]